MRTEQQKPRITCLANGPYQLLTPTTVPGLRRANGETCATTRAVTLCRCGGSRNKPFCDGTHDSIAFSDARAATGTAAAARVGYVGRHITIHDDRSICAHSGICTDSLKAVFRLGQKSWIDPDGADAQAIIETVQRCPSGALSYSVAGVEHRDVDRPPLVTVSDNGPYQITGGIELKHVAFAPGASTEHYTLCRCGASQNKPFCDGAHWKVGFQDAASSDAAPDS